MQALNGIRAGGYAKSGVFNTREGFSVATILKVQSDKLVTL